jgi:hypothetical protein
MIWPIVQITVPKRFTPYASKRKATGASKNNAACSGSYADIVWNAVVRLNVL